MQLNINTITKVISDGSYDKAFYKLYGNSVCINDVRKRYQNAAEKFCLKYGSMLNNDTDLFLFSVPGRSEISGNHTDHNHGKVLAASISLDIIAVAAPIKEAEIRIYSEGFPEDIVSIENVSDIAKDDLYKSSALIRGVCDGFTKRDYNIGGFVAYTTSDVLKGSGLSSSAAFEVMVGNILNHFYNRGKVDTVEIAKISQYAENVHFGKPSGLMDQTACAVGGFVAIDFENPKNPVVEKLSFDLSSKGYSLCIVNTGGNHADLNDDYASIPAEMKKVAEFFGKEFLRDVKKEDLLYNAAKIREYAGDRAFLRSLHFLDENLRVTKQTLAIKEDNIIDFLLGVRSSGYSSVSKLQNIFTVKNVSEQGLSVALALAEELLKDRTDAAYRVHGGGFAGTIQAFVPNKDIDSFKNIMESVFGEKSVYILNIRLYGAVCLTELLK